MSLNKYAPKGYGGTGFPDSAAVPPNLPPHSELRHLPMLSAMILTEAEGGLRKMSIACHRLSHALT